MRRRSGTRATPARSMISGGRPVTSRPSTVTRPSLGTWSPAIARSRVDLPAPLAPISATSSPARIVNDTSRSACTEP